MRASIERLLNRDALFATLLSAAVTLAAVAGLMLSRAPAPLIVMELRTEILTQRVARPELSAMPLVGARIAQAEDCAALLVDGLFTGVVRPPEGALVNYGWQPDALLVDIRAPAEGNGFAASLLSTSDEQECRLAPQQLRLRVAPPPGATDHAWQLPVAGPAQAGSEFGTPLAPRPGSQRPFDLLLEGNVEVFGKSVFGGELFPAGGASYIVPAGSRIASADHIEPGAAPAGASWYGIAFYETDGLHVSATTETSELRLFRPGPGDQREVFGLGLLASVLGDPALGTFTFALAVFLTVLGLVSGWMGLFRDTQAASPAPPVPPVPPDPPIAPAPVAKRSRRRTAGASDAKG